jgi:arabinose-5-phosphate isomerase
MEKCEDFVNGTAADMMTRNPITMPQDTMIIDAEEKMTKHRISTLLITMDTGCDWFSQDFRLIPHLFIPK